MRKIISVCLLFFIAAVCNAHPTIISTYNTESYDNEIKCIYKNVLTAGSMPTRIEKVSRYFLGKKYIFGALGEGYSGEFDKSPLYRTDAFDCETFVATVLALVVSNSFAEYVNNIKKIQYKEGKVSYFNRYHFTEVDWNIANRQNGFLKDITTQILGSKIAYAIIDKPQWFRKHSTSSLKCFTQISDQTSKNLLRKIQDHAKNMHSYVAKTSYLPLSVLMQHLSQNQNILDKIPSGTIVEIVDKTQHLQEKIGTDLNVVHLGIALRTFQGLIFRHASKVHGKVVDVLLVDYLKRYYALSKDPQKVGIHLELISAF